MKTRAHQVDEFMWGQRPARAEACLSHALLDRLALGESDPGEARAAEAHLATCATCAATRVALEADRAQFVANHNLGGLAADALVRAAQAGPLPASPAAEAGIFQRWQLSAKRLLVPAALAAAAGAALLIVGGPRAPHPDTVRTKGGFGLTVYVLHTEAGAATATEPTGKLHLGEPLHPGDRIRLELGTREPGYALVLAIDQAAHVSVYHPQGPRAVALDTSHEGGVELLPAAIELDDTLGSETLLALRCREPVEVSAAVAAVKRAAGGPLDLPCAETRYVITKAPR